MNSIIRTLWRTGSGAFFFSLGLTAAQGAQLQPETARAYEQHVAATADWNRGAAPDASFLKTDLSAERPKLQNGAVVIEPFQGKGDIPVEKGIIHHWVGAVFVPGANAEQAAALLRDFDAYKEIYPAAVADSKTVKRQGDVYEAYLRLRKQRIVTVVLNTQYRAEFERLDGKRWRSRSLSTRIAQVKDAGSGAERELPVGDDSGFLWRIATFWRFEEADGGVYLECEVVALTRGVPYGLGWLVRPIIRSFPRESLSETLNDTRNALLGAQRHGRPPAVSEVPLRSAANVVAEIPH